jgi:hypothetical protein
MSLAQFNSISSNASLNVNSITFPNGTSIDSLPTYYTQTISPFSNINSGITKIIATFNNIPEGYYLVSYSLENSVNSIAPNQNAFTQLTNSVGVTPRSEATIYYTLSSFQFIDTSLNTGFTDIKGTYGGIFQIPSNSTVFITSAGFLAQTGSTCNINTDNNNKVILVKLIAG